MRNSWTICDLYDAHEALDIQEKLRKIAMDKARQESKR